MNQETLPEARLKELGITLPTTPAPDANFTVEIEIIERVKDD